MKCFAIGDEFTVLGFRLAGISGSVATSPEQATVEFTKATTQNDIGLILITERIADMIKTEIEDAQIKKRLPLVLEIPDRQGSIPERDTVVDLIRKVFGIRL